MNFRHFSNTIACKLPASFSCTAVWVNLSQKFGLTHKLWAITLLVLNPPIISENISTVKIQGYAMPYALVRYRTVRISSIFLYFDLFCTSTAFLRLAYFELCSSTFCQIWIYYWSRSTGRSKVWPKRSK